MKKSKDPNTKVGAVIVGEDQEIKSTGYCNPPRNIEDSEVPVEHPEKYYWFEHAERNAIYQGGRHGVSFKNCTMYVSKSPSCAACSRAIIQVGIKRVVQKEIDKGLVRLSDQKDEIEAGREMMRQAGVQVDKI